MILYPEFDLKTKLRTLIRLVIKRVQSTYFTNEANHGLRSFLFSFAVYLKLENSLLLLFFYFNVSIIWLEKNVLKISKHVHPLLGKMLYPKSRKFSRKKCMIVHFCDMVLYAMPFMLDILREHAYFHHMVPGNQVLPVLNFIISIMGNK